MRALETQRIRAVFVPRVVYRVLTRRPLAMAAVASPRANRWTACIRSLLFLRREPAPMRVPHEGVVPQ